MGRKKCIEVECIPIIKTSRGLLKTMSYESTYAQKAAKASRFILLRFLSLRQKPTLRPDIWLCAPACVCVEVTGGQVTAETQREEERRSRSSLPPTSPDNTSVFPNELTSVGPDYSLRSVTDRRHPMINERVSVELRVTEQQTERESKVLEGRTSIIPFGSSADCCFLFLD